ncbi:hypothetical protein N7468_006607 [Penicillium chermesinum]|uniref:Uncharacterized protein n=1 Tax=Penicillium chermesinum TaxID=63820 RepID=A0A9W9NSI7_9EURO|nr:uncharacterized protein N7468_006607 [Penicillium chermesinum]KAJ5225382.1 hypothetical protein N7468_006607 [Penicillium chermesinum]KAJ6161393.1 hypothetical protein N7470_004789 [Penicillium chermesinum]
MIPLGLWASTFSLSNVNTTADGMYHIATNCSLLHPGLENLSGTLAELWTSLTGAAMQWLSRPDVLAIITAWWITFTVVVTICLCLGFGSGGIVVGSLAAAFQSFMYGGFTPAGGIFATLTSMAMLGTFLLPVVLLGCIIATGVGVAVWRLGYGIP